MKKLARGILKHSTFNLSTCLLYAPRCRAGSWYASRCRITHVSSTLHPFHTQPSHASHASVHATHSTSPCTLPPPPPLLTRTRRWQVSIPPHSKLSLVAASAAHTGTVKKLLKGKLQNTSNALKKRKSKNVNILILTF